ncbi:hypothetical protein A2U01_0068877, partial [Trifolium medium]|nr:hypothetical protein [Trifolium medium]
MSSARTLLGHNNASPVSKPEKSKEEEDQQERNTKKAKGGEQSFSVEVSKVGSYRNKVI